MFNQTRSVAGRGRLRSNAAFKLNGKTIGPDEQIILGPDKQKFELEAGESPVKLESPSVGKQIVCPTRMKVMAKVDFQGGVAWGGKNYNYMNTYVYSYEI